MSLWMQTNSGAAISFDAPDPAAITIEERQP